MNIAQVKAKARAAMKRREEEIEAEEIEGGEINLVPYLDIVTNLMLFMLATVSAGFILGQIDTTLPNHTPANQVSAADPSKTPDEQPLQIVVSVTKQRLLVWSISGLEGTLAEPKLELPVTGSTGPDQAPSFEYQRLNDTLYEIASRRYGNGTKPRPMDTYEILLQVDGDIPYETVVDVMDYLRRRVTDSKLQPVDMPEAAQQGDELVPTENYDPDEHYLFPDVIFAKPSFE